LVSNGYIGLDQQYNIQLEVIEPLKGKMQMFAGNYTKDKI
jgi:hypothetical protein